MTSYITHQIYKELLKTKYKFPKKYIQWEDLAKLVAYCLNQNSVIYPTDNTILSTAIK